jgi:voltage-gated potassium channel
MTTVGYGDVTPNTDLGRLVATIASLTGVCMLGVPAGLIAAGLVEEWDKLKTQERLGQRKKTDFYFE